MDTLLVHCNVINEDFQQQICVTLNMKLSVDDMKEEILYHDDIPDDICGTLGKWRIDLVHNDEITTLDDDAVLCKEQVIMLTDGGYLQMSIRGDGEPVPHDKRHKVANVRSFQASVTLDNGTELPSFTANVNTQLPARDVIDIILTNPSIKHSVPKGVINWQLILVFQDGYECLAEDDCLDMYNDKDRLSTASGLQVVPRIQQEGQQAPGMREENMGLQMM